MGSHAEVAAGSKEPEMGRHAEAAAIELVQHTQRMKGAGTSAASAGWSETVLARLASKADELRQQRESGNPTKTPQEIEIRRAVGLSGVAANKVDRAPGQGATVLGGQGQSDEAKVCARRCRCAADDDEAKRRSGRSAAAADPRRSGGPRRVRRTRASGAPL